MGFPDQLSALQLYTSSHDKHCCILKIPIKKGSSEMCFKIYAIVLLTSVLRGRPEMSSSKTPIFEPTYLLPHNF